MNRTDVAEALQAVHGKDVFLVVDGHRIALAGGPGNLEAEVRAVLEAKGFDVQTASADDFEGRVHLERPALRLDDFLKAKDRLALNDLAPLEEPPKNRDQRRRGGR